MSSQRAHAVLTVMVLTACGSSGSESTTPLAEGSTTESTTELATTTSLPVVEVPTTSPTSLDIVSVPESSGPEPQTTQPLVSDPVLGNVSLAEPSTMLTPTVIASFPAGQVGDLAVAPMSGNRAAVVTPHMVTILDAATGQELSTHPIALPDTWLGWVVAIGPDDVLYLPDNSTQTLVAYGLHDGSYIEVARTGFVFTDYPFTVGPTGIHLDNGDELLGMDYVDSSGAPSGATLDLPHISIHHIDEEVVRYERGVQWWLITYQASSDCFAEGASLCDNARIGPRHSVILDDRPQPTNGVRNDKLTLLADGVTS